MYTSIYVTAGSEKEAKEIAKNILEKRLIACANLFPISSYYYWDGKMQEDSEFGIIMKTRTTLVDKLIDEVKKIHSYDVPCIVSWPISNGNKDYLAWIAAETQNNE